MGAVDEELMGLLRESAMLNVRVDKRYAQLGRVYHGSGNRYFTYALLLQNNKIYVGDTDNIYARLLTHVQLSEGSAKWVKTHGPVKRVLEITYDAQPGAENERMLEYADIFGFENVRGANHCRLDMPNPPTALAGFKRGKMQHNFLQRNEIRDIESHVRDMTNLTEFPPRRRSPMAI